MEKVRKLIWEGLLNVEVAIDNELIIPGTPRDECLVHLRIPRDSYLVIYLPTILHKLKDVLKDDTLDAFKGWWFGMENVFLYWNHPVGVLYDSLSGLNPALRKANTATNEFINVWKITLSHRDEIPSGMIPIIYGTKQIQEFWMHQWKQACFILNGSSKQVMSLSMSDSMQFWEGVLQRNDRAFQFISEKIIPGANAIRNIPLKIHQTLPEVKVVQPTVKATNNEKNTTLGEVLHKEFPQWFPKSGGTPELAKPIIQGIEVPLEFSLADLYYKLVSLDGFLHVSICLISSEENAK